MTPPSLTCPNVVTTACSENRTVYEHMYTRKPPTISTARVTGINTRTASTPCALLLLLQSCENSLSLRRRRERRHHRGNLFLVHSNSDLVRRHDVHAPTLCRGPQRVHGSRDHERSRSG